MKIIIQLLIFKIISYQESEFKLPETELNKFTFNTPMIMLWPKWFSHEVENTDKCP